MKLLLIAYACSPDHGSEEGVGFNFVKAVSMFSKCKVITTLENKKILEKSSLKNVEWIFIEENLFKKKFKKFWTFFENTPLRPLLSLSYNSWQKKVEKYVNNYLIKKEQIDIVHRITYVGYRFPFKVTNQKIKLVFGPVGGTENFNIKFFKFLTTKIKIYYFLRNVLNQIQLSFSKKINDFLNRENCYVLAAHSKIALDLKKYYGVNSKIFSEICLDHGLKQKAPYARNDILKIIWVGKFDSSKNLPPLLRAKHNLQNKGINFELTICGNGDQEKNWKNYAKNLKLKNINWEGKISRKEVLHKMSKSHVYVTTSLKDLTSTTLIEAISSGCVIIATPLTGFKDALGNTSNYFIDIKNKRNFISSIETHIAFINYNDKLRLKIGNENIRQSEFFGINKVSKKLEDLYKNILKQVL